MPLSLEHLFVLTNQAGQVLRLNWGNVIQFLVVFVLVTWVYFKIQGTYIAQLLKGVAVILSFYLVAQILNWQIISAILQVVLQISIIGFIILFQPELRRLLVYLGQPDLLGRTTYAGGDREKDAHYIVHAVIESVRILSRSKTGALIVLESSSEMGGNYLEAGTRLNARVSTELLLTIFHPNTPLHDGAVVISPDSQVVAAGVLLPLSENPNISWKYGTRHRAAIGLSETSDSRCLVVSEETGSISLVSHGSIEKINSMEDLKEQLDEIYHLHDGASKDGKKVAPLLAELFSSDLFQKLFTKNEAEPTASAPVGKSALTDDRPHS